MASEPNPRPSASAADASPERRTTAWVGKSLKIQGHIVSDDDLTIDGDVEGTIVVGDHTLTVGPGATVKADLTARTITVSGTVIGKVRAHELLVLGTTASVIGEIVATSLRMADGAIVQGPVDAAGARSATTSAAGSR
jgi:cytoskeletal protein CcmA (bactofilin family)